MDTIKNLLEIIRKPQITNDEIVSLFAGIAKIMIQFIMSVALIFFILTAIKMITSGGDQSVTANAKKSMLYIVIGILLGVGALALLNFITAPFVR